MLQAGDGVFDAICRLLRDDLRAHESEERIHISIEAAHPDHLGRPAGLVMDEMLRRPMLNDTNGVDFHFIEDRLRIPANLHGHVICIGGPRSNVLARAALEYESINHRNNAHYRRINNPSTRLAIEYLTHGDDTIDEHPDLNSGIFKPAKLCFGPDILKMIGDKERQIEREANPFDGTTRFQAFSPARYFKASGAERTRRTPRDKALETHEFRAVTLRSFVDKATIREYYLFDYLLFTMMPNVFSENYQSDQLLIYHGLRSLGTLGALRLIRQPEHLEDVREALERERYDPATEKFTFRQGLLSVARTGGALAGSGSESIQFATPRVSAEPQTDGDQSYRLDRVEWQLPKGAVEQLHTELRDGSVSRKAYQKHLVRTNQIDAEQILSAMSLRRDHRGRRDGVYVLGCFEDTKTIYTQQARAYTLIHALHKAGEINRDTKITIVGGGASGIAAAIAAARSRSRVHLLEASPHLMPRQIDAHHRFIHPYFYDWPNLLRHDEEESDLLWLRWKAGSAASVRQQILDCFDNARNEINRDGADQHRLTLLPNYRVQAYFFDRRNKKHCVSRLSSEDLNALWPSQEAGEGRARVTDPFLGIVAEQTHFSRKERANIFHLRQQARQRRPNSAEARGDDGYGTSFDYDNVIDSDILIFATGFGVDEVSQRFFPDLVTNRSYWEDDTVRFKDLTDAIEQFKPRQQNVATAPPAVPNLASSSKGDAANTLRNPKTVLVSGSGDGALIDILRVCIRNFDHGSVVRQLCGFSGAERDPEIIPMPDFSKLGSDEENHVPPRRRPNSESELAQRIIGAGESLARLFSTPSFHFKEAEAERISDIKSALSGFNVETIFEDLGLQLRNVVVYNVAQTVQPFGSGSGVAHRLLVFALYLRGKVRFYTGQVSVESDGSVKIKRSINGEERVLNQPSGILIRHGVGDQPGAFMDDIEELMNDPSDLEGSEESRKDERKRVVRDARELVALLRLTNGLHPETYKFFHYTLRSLK